VSVANPQWFFRLTGLPPSNTPEIFATLGMVLGLYGVLYLDVARRPASGWLIAAVALAGKILGPLGLAWLILTDTWPPVTIVLVITNDLIWWAPFARYLRDAWPAFRASPGPAVPGLAAEVPAGRQVPGKQACGPAAPDRRPGPSVSGGPR
jgi:hypothetical protein